MFEEDDSLALAAFASLTDEGRVQNLAVAYHVFVEVVRHKESLREEAMIGCLILRKGTREKPFEEIYAPEVLPFLCESSHSRESVDLKS